MKPNDDTRRASIWFLDFLGGEEGHVEEDQVPAPRRGLRRLRRQGQGRLCLVVRGGARARV